MGGTYPTVDRVDRVQERSKAAVIARHYRDQEGLPIAEIARRLGRAPATVKSYLYDPSEANKRPAKRPTRRRDLVSCQRGIPMRWRAGARPRA